MKSFRKKATIKDVAFHAGVSPATVSMVLNSKDANIPESTRKRVLSAARAVQYYTDYNARAMVTGKTNLIGVVIPDITNAFFAECVRYIQTELAKRRYDVVLCNSEEKAESDFRYLRLLAGRNVDGIILAPSAESLTGGRAEELHELLSDLHVPCVFLDRYSGQDDAKVIVSNEESSYRIARYLLECGHRKIAAVTGPLTLNSSFNRLKGLKRAMGEYSLELLPQNIYEGKYDFETGLAAGLKLMQTDVTAVFAFSDIQAYGIYEAGRRLKKRIPDDISVVGFDDNFYSSMLETPLTTMRQPLKQIAEEACRIILDLVEDREGEKSIGLPAELVIRDSVKKIEA